MCPYHLCRDILVDAAVPLMLMLHAAASASGILAKASTDRRVYVCVNVNCAETAWWTQRYESVQSGVSTNDIPTLNRNTVRQHSNNQSTACERSPNLCIPAFAMQLD